VSAKAEITSLAAPIADSALDQLADVLVDCVAGGASVSFMSPFPHDSALGFFRKVAGSVAAGDTVLLAAKLDGKIVGTVQLGLDTPPNQPHRADIKKMLVHRSARGRGIGAALMAAVEEEAHRRGRWLLVLDTVPGEKVQDDRFVPAASPGASGNHATAVPIGSGQLRPIPAVPRKLTAAGI